MTVRRPTTIFCTVVQGRVMIVLEIGARKAEVFLCRADVRVRSAGKANSLHNLYDWGAAVTLVTHAAAVSIAAVVHCTKWQKQKPFTVNPAKKCGNFLKENLLIFFVSTNSSSGR